MPASSPAPTAGSGACSSQGRAAPSRARSSQALRRPTTPWRRRTGRCARSRTRRPRRRVQSATAAAAWSMTNSALCPLPHCPRLAAAEYCSYGRRLARGVSSCCSKFWTDRAVVAAGRSRRSASWDHRSWRWRDVCCSSNDVIWRRGPASVARRGSCFGIAPAQSARGGRNMAAAGTGARSSPR